MEHSREQVKEAILFFADKCQLKEAYEYHVKNVVLPELVKMIIYDLVVSGYDPYNFADQMNILLCYAREYKAVGFVTHEK